MPVFQEAKQADNACIFFLGKVHLVAVTYEFYVDDLREYIIRIHEDCIENLVELISTEDSKSSTGEMDQSTAVEKNIKHKSILNMSAVHNVEVLGIRGGGDDI